MLNILMSFGAIWTFSRMAPAIEKIIEQNEKSLHACEGMLSHLILVQTANSSQQPAPDEDEFLHSLDIAKNNITEPREPEYIANIERSYQAAVTGNVEAIRETTFAINNLSNVNREAMVRADEKAKKIGRAGAWGVVFMTTSFFIIAMIFLRSLQRNVITPMDELHATLNSHNNGDHFRRCGPHHPHPDIRYIYEGINRLIDKTS